MSNLDEPPAAWETRLQDMSPVDGRDGEEERVETGRLVAQRASWPMLHDVEDGATVDMSQVWPVLGKTGPPERATALVETLARQAGGAAQRLLFGVRSLSDRSDHDMLVHVDVVTGDLLEIAAWSPGCPLNPDRSWWLRCTLAVESATGFEAGGINGVDLRPHRTAFAVGGQDGVTVFQEDFGGPLGDIAARFYLAWEGRRALADRLGWRRPEPPSRTLPLAEFLQQARKRVWPSADML
ncbi:hypothetical protein [Planomonospora parontospora]|uniref:hypothetical protein n=1 Tax=Planomonospora parontospora TaxID=58119 RepID=UPI0016704D0E|nr:hypothetical protein [Planomonospora parontospora]GGL41006.1 hypothetical protein GCM10014719_47830 [Planomonospora parontospora subsp. antibiotica]GII17912.1 hypothetical protein Ppa05_46380 [Planomonospora parontospora subsp. antibiotica]